MSTTLITFPSHDNKSDYLVSAQVLGPQEASISVRKTDKASGQVTNGTFPITNISVVNGIMHGVVHLFGGLTQDFTLEPSPTGDEPTETIETGGFAFGIGAQRIGPLQVSPKDLAKGNDWMTNFPHS